MQEGRKALRSGSRLLLAAPRRTARCSQQLCTVNSQDLRLALVAPATALDAGTLRVQHALAAIRASGVVHCPRVVPHSDGVKEQREVADTVRAVQVHELERVLGCEQLRQELAVGEDDHDAHQAGLDDD